MSSNRIKIEAVSGTPFKIGRGRWQFNTPGTDGVVATAKLSIATEGGRQPVVLDLETPGIRVEYLAGCTITPTMVDTILDVFPI